MENLLLWIGRIVGLGGAVLCGVAAAARLSGRYWLGSFQMGTLLQAGMAAMILGCLCFLAALTERGKVGR
ncbi:MAG: hypothetical protein L0387_29930 [Acidobacteria bacterium]|nr:hypothetical protein [Acidobacteriota bacterium]MCI0625815.1 hypothetical protein [Acidobacteriota bacterium]MCI0718453.1 hypothetical protein [Acidobacteriota bacterium]